MHVWENGKILQVFTNFMEEKNDFPKSAQNMVQFRKKMKLDQSHKYYQ